MRLISASDLTDREGSEMAYQTLKGNLNHPSRLLQQPLDDSSRLGADQRKG